MLSPPRYKSSPPGTPDSFILNAPDRAAAHGNGASAEKSENHWFKLGSQASSFTNCSEIKVSLKTGHNYISFFLCSMVITNVWIAIFQITSILFDEVSEMALSLRWSTMATKQEKPLRSECQPASTWVAVASEAPWRRLRGTEGHGVLSRCESLCTN